MIVKKPLILAALCAVSAFASADDFANSSFIHKWSDVQLYLKPKYNCIRTWDQEFGVQATLYKHGFFSQVTNFAYDPTYPLRADQKPRFTIGFQFNYQILGGQFPVNIYTKPKASPLPYVWKDETGFSCRLYKSRSVTFSTSAAYIYNIPYHHGQLPQWLALVNLAFPLG